MLVGDSLDGLNVLKKQEHMVGADGIRLVYIDPPFNRGNNFLQYNDSLTHSAWLSMLRDRLVAVKPLLGATSSIWVHLDDAEQHRGRCFLDEVFGEKSFVTTIVWQTKKTRDSRAAFSNNHDYIHVYSPVGPQEWKKNRNLLPRRLEALKNPDEDSRGPWSAAPFNAP